MSSCHGGMLLKLWAVGIHTTDATNYLILSTLGRWGLDHPSPRVRVMNHPGTLTRATPPQRGTLFRDGTGAAADIF